MQTISTPARRSAALRMPNALLALLFWGFTYVLFAYRANLRYGDAYELFTVERLVSTAIGAGLYWLVLSLLIDGTRDQPGKAVSVLLTILPASIVVLLARVLLDQFIPRPDALATDLRFVMVWAGYFGLWVSASFVLRTLPRMELGSETAVEFQVRRPAKNRVTSRRGDNGLARAEFLERLALEIATLPTAERKALFEAFAVPARYETADELELWTRD